METLLQNTKINHNSLKKFLMKVTAHELTELSNPCYYPKLKKNYFELLHLTGLKEQDAKTFVKRFYKGTKYSEFLLQKDPIANLIIFIMFYFLKVNDVAGYTTTMAYFIIRNYANLIHKQISFCNEYAFKYALEHLAKTHLFSREKTVSNSLYFMSKEIMRRYTKGIKKGNPEEIGKMITETRTRISQSIKSFAEAYYKATKSNTIIRNPYESENDTDSKKYQELVQDKHQRIIETIAKKICVYKYIDKKAIMDAKSITKINMSLATLLSSSLTDVKYLDDIKNILKLYLKNLTDVKMLCKKEYFTFLRNLMSIKRTTSTLYFKQQIQLIVGKIIDDINHKDRYERLSSQSRFMINLYVAFYITMILRNTIC